MTLTPNHKLFTARGWKRADELELGDILVSGDGLHSLVLGIEVSSEGYFEVRTNGYGILESEVIE